MTKKEDDDNALQKSDNKSFRFKHKLKKDLDHFMNSWQKDREIKENETKSFSLQTVCKGYSWRWYKTSEKGKGDHRKINLTSQEGRKKQ